MIAHFSEKLGVSPVRMSRAAVRVKPAASPEPAVNQWAGLAQLPRRYRQLVDFLLLYPEFFNELMDAGLETVVKEQLLVNFIQFLKELHRQGACSPENIFSALPEGEVRKYAAKLFLEVGNRAAEDEAGSRAMCSELIFWLNEEKRLLEEADLLQRIRVAQESGDQEKMMELLRRKQECGRKRTGFCDNLLKNE